MQDSVKIDRHKFLGGSDIATIMGLNPYKSRWQLMREKAQLDTDTFEGNAYTEYGNSIEEKIRNYVNETYGYNFVESKFTIYSEALGERGHLDGEDPKKLSVLECKSTSHIFPSVDEYPVYLVQLLYYMMRRKRARGVLAVYERPDDMSLDFDPLRLQVWFIRLSDYSDTVENIETAIKEFKRDVRKLKRDPSLTEEAFLPKEVVQVSRAIIALERKLASMEKIEADLKAQKLVLRSLMEKHDIKSWKTPKGFTITYCQATTAERIDSKRLKEERPDIYNEFSKVSNVSACVKITAPKKGGGDYNGN